MSAPPPKTITFNPDGWPDELNSRRQFVPWRWARVDGRWTKHPINPHSGQLAHVDKPATWGTLAEAIEATLRYDLDGIGFVLSEDDDYFGIDLDGVVNPDTGEISDLGLATMARHPDLHWERSVRGGGIHGLGRTRQTPHEGTGNNDQKRGIESYWSGRFFCMTGVPLPGYGAPVIPDVTEDFLAWHAETFPPKTKPAAPPITPPELTADDAEVVRRILSTAKGRRLYQDGDFSKYPSQSEADQALANLLVMAHATPDQVDRIFRTSPLMRDKWDQPARRGETYGTGTIARAFDGTVQPWSGWSTNPVESPIRQAAVANESVPTDPIPEGDGCEIRLAIAHRRIAELETQLAAARADNSAIIGTVQNPNLNLAQIRAALGVVTTAIAKRDNGQTNDDGLVPITTGDISNDFRPKPAAGERLAPINTDGSKPRMARANVKPILAEAVERGLIEAIPRQIERPHASGGTYKDTVWEVTPPASLAAALNPWATWKPEEPVTRKPRTLPAACPECGEVHAIRRTDSCTGCGVIIRSRTIEPETEEAAAEAPNRGGDILSPPEKAPGSSVVSTRIGRSIISGLPTEPRVSTRDKTSPPLAEPAWLMDAPDPVPFSGFEPTPLDRYTDVAIGARK